MTSLKKVSMAARTLSFRLYSFNVCLDDSIIFKRKNPAAFHSLLQLASLQGALTLGSSLLWVIVVAQSLRCFFACLVVVHNVATTRIFLQEATSVVVDEFDYSQRQLGFLIVVAKTCLAWTEGLHLLEVRLVPRVVI